MDPVILPLGSIGDFGVSGGSPTGQAIFTPGEGLSAASEVSPFPLILEKEDSFIWEPH